MLTALRRLRREQEGRLPKHFFYLDGKTQMQVLTRAQAVAVRPQGGAGRALRGEGDVVVDVLAPLHQQLGVGIVRPLRGAPQYFLADFPWLSTAINTVSCDVSSGTTGTLNSIGVLIISIRSDA